MEKIFNVLLVFGVLVALYYCIQKHKQENVVEEKLKQKSLVNVVEKFNMDKIKYDEPQKQNKVLFNYDVRPIENQFVNEQKNGASVVPHYPNRWIESFDSNGDPVYNSREKPGL
jgi:hypothetical protein